MGPRRGRDVVAMYSITLFDWSWNEMGESDSLLTAHELVRQIDCWNQRCQRVALDESVVITPQDLPTHFSIGVHYVERQEKAIKRKSGHSKRVEGCGDGEA
jgi:hypothetical protein